MFKGGPAAPSHQDDLRRLQESDTRQKKPIKSTDDDAFPSLPGGPPKMQQSSRRKPIMESDGEEESKTSAFGGAAAKKGPAWDPFSGGAAPMQASASQSQFATTVVQGTGKRGGRKKGRGGYQKAEGTQLKQGFY